MISIGRVCGKPGPRGLNVIGNLRLQLLERVKFLFRPDPMTKGHGHIGTIDILFKIQQVDLQHGLPLLFHGRSIANIGHASHCPHGAFIWARTLFPGSKHNATMAGINAMERDIQPV